MKRIKVKMGNAVWEETWRSVEEFASNCAEMMRGVEMVSSRYATADEIASFNAENCAAEYYAKYGTIGEF